MFPARAHHDGIRRMPVIFGPSPGPRQMPDGSLRRGTRDGTAASISFTTAVSEEGLTRLLPPGVHPVGEARITTTFASLRELPWLAGRGYNLVEITAPVTAQVLDEGPADFSLVVFENMADPIISGREELGWSKVFADISDVVLPRVSERLAVAWDSHEFIAATVLDLQEQTLSDGATRPRLHLKSMPSTGDWGRNDLQHFTVTPGDDPYRIVEWAGSGTGTLSFLQGTFRQLPTLLHIANGLSALAPSDEVEVRASFTRGRKSLLDQGRA
jgi:hypothetical protein